MAERATLEELQEFANRVRAAGGGNPIDALIPAVPEDASQCLIARNLNFNCQVAGGNKAWGVDCGSWIMQVNERSVRDKIAEELGLEKADLNVRYDPDDYAYAVVLPDEIGQVADDFDTAGSEIHYFSMRASGLAQELGLPEKEAIAKAWEEIEPEVKSMIVDFYPYIEASKEEAYSLASIINPDGSIVV